MVGEARVPLAGGMTLLRSDAPTPKLADAWHLTVLCWDDPKSHDELLQLAREHDAYPWLAAKYREVAQVRPYDRIATHHLTRLHRIAAHTFLLRTPSEQTASRPYRSTRLLLVMLVALVAVGTVFAQLRSSAAHAGPVEVAPR